ncbi:S41 family peptidase [Geobacter luticola]|uniref:S41 family peptidase n=2 Tax=Geomobilimonas luticola TaxID=1114878 RepID=A0ABS5SHR1_9BACT|nr:S41 family peptidase [Geomobilimonas luticola]
MQRVKRFFLLTTGVTIAILAVMASMQFVKRTVTRSDQDYLNLFRQVIGTVDKSYVEKVEPKKLMQSAITGMLASLDPHSAYLPPEPFKEMNIQMSGSFGGLGIEITMKDGKLTVVSPIEDTPAFRAGIKPNDHIAKIDDKPTRGLTITEAVNRMRGKQGTKVTLSILREGSPTPLVFPLVRATIQTKSLKFRTLEPGYGLVRISHFQQHTGDEVVAALDKLRGQNDGTLKGLIIDLRNNPGGLLESCTQVAGRFIGDRLDNGLIVSTRGRLPDANQQLTASIGPKEPPYPIVVLINGGTASASEILAGALQDHKRAIVMGTQSFGKGSVQSVITLRDGAGLKLTTALYYTPSGRSIQAKGITPDIVVGNIDLKEAKKQTTPEFHEKDLDGHMIVPEKGDTQPPSPATRPSTPAKPDGELAGDYQLFRALELLRGLDVMAVAPLPRKNDRHNPR